MPASVHIPLHSGDGGTQAYALVDPDDASLARRHRWTRNGRYAMTKIDGRTAYLHRLLMGLAPGDRQEVDHRNLDGLDCRRHNMRLGTHAENLQNVVGGRGYSRYRGVSWDKRKRLWKASACLNGVNYQLGYYDDEGAAALAASAFRQQHMAFSADAALPPITPPPRYYRRDPRHLSSYCITLIRCLRATTSLTGTQIADLVGVSQCTVSGVLSGKRHPVKVTSP